MAQYDFNLAPNGAQTLEVSGTYFTYKGGLGPIRVTPSSGDSVELLPGQGMSGLKFDRLTIKDLSGAINGGAVLAGNGAWRDERIAGTVEIIDGGRTRTMANQAFIGTTYIQAAAGQFPAIMLWNPAGSGKRLIVERVKRGSNASGNLGIVIRNAPCVTLDKSAQSKLSGGAPSTAEFRIESKVNINGTALASESTATGTERERAFVVPVVILPGYGLELWAGMAGSDIQGSFEFIEEIIQ